MCKWINFKKCGKNDVFGAERKREWWEMDLERVWPSKRRARGRKEVSFRFRYPIARFIVHFVAVIKLEYKLCACVCVDVFAAASCATNICMTYRIFDSHFCHSLDRYCRCCRCRCHVPFCSAYLLHFFVMIFYFDRHAAIRVCMWYMCMVNANGVCKIHELTPNISFNYRRNGQLFGVILFREVNISSATLCFFHLLIWFAWNISTTRGAMLCQVGILLFPLMPGKENRIWSWQS